MPHGQDQEPWDAPAKLFFKNHKLHKIPAIFKGQEETTTENSY